LLPGGSAATIVPVPFAPSTVAWDLRSGCNLAQARQKTRNYLTPLCDKTPQNQSIYADFLLRKHLRQPMRRPLILHITGDYPDPVREPTTEAVKRLIDRLMMYDHITVSLKRLPDPRAGYFTECPAPPSQRIFAYGYFGLPFGIGLYVSFRTIAARIERLLADENLQPDLIHSHRLTFDGIAGSLLSRRHNIPHFISVRGEVESKIFRFKPTYRPLLRRIAHGADRLLYVSAWYEPHLTAATGSPPEKGRSLPNMVGNVTREITPRAPGKSIVVAANLDIYRKKGLDRLIPAFGRVAAQLPGVTLEIFGGGTATAKAAVKRLITDSGVGDRVVLHGQVPNSQFLAALPSALALAMPSHNETFGMVFAEALFAGVPVLFSQMTGIDGYLDDLHVGIRVNPTDDHAIAVALVSLVNDNAKFREQIARHSGTIFERFDPGHQVALYVADVEHAMATRSKNKLSPPFGVAIN
jgi:glycosyltransferase involved in cell wall biosynthesis